MSSMFEIFFSFLVLVTALQYSRILCSGRHTSNEDQYWKQSTAALNRTVYSAQFTTDCGEGFYLHFNFIEKVSTCEPCYSNGSAYNTTPDCKNCTQDPLAELPVECQTKQKNNFKSHTDFRFINIFLFTLAILVDIFYVYLYSRTFLRKNVHIFRGRNCAVENWSRLMGTAGIDLHIVFCCVHFFGVICEVGVVMIDERNLWMFTLIMGIASVGVYFLDALLFLVVKRVICTDVCTTYRPRDSQNVGHSRSGEAETFLDGT